METPNKAMWDEGIRYLGQHGFTEGKARGLIGRWSKKYPAEKIGDALFRAELHCVRKPIPYITATLNKPDPEPEDSFYTSREWREVRYRALSENDGCCECCKARPVKDKPLHVDHIKPRCKFPELELELTNLQCLCADCNLGKGAWDQTDWRD